MLKTKELAVMQVNNELDAGLKALGLGNDGKARVCARRACYAIVDFWLKDHQEYKWGNNAISILQSVKDERSFPIEIREAAKRLITKVKQDFSTGFDDNPIDDAKIIVQYFLSYYK